jgi:hypothetical protein
MIVQDFLFRKRRWGICRVTKWIVNTKLWEKREKEDLDTLSEWLKSVRSLIQIIIKRKLSGSMSTRFTSIFKDPNVAKHLSLHHDTLTV